MSSMTFSETTRSKKNNAVNKSSELDKSVKAFGAKHVMLFDNKGNLAVIDVKTGKEISTPKKLEKSNSLSGLEIQLKNNTDRTITTNQTFESTASTEECCMTYGNPITGEILKMCWPKTPNGCF